MDTGGSTARTSTPGLSDLAPGMTLRDLHSPFYIAADRELCRTVKPGERVEVPLFASFLTDADVGPELTLEMELYGWNALGAQELLAGDSRGGRMSPG